MLDNNNMDYLETHHFSYLTENFFSIEDCYLNNNTTKSRRELKIEEYIMKSENHGLHKIKNFLDNLIIFGRFLGLQCRNHI